MGELVVRWDRNPDGMFNGCRVTDNVEEGVDFPGLEPLVGDHTFIGKSALIEAIAVLYGMRGNDVLRALEGGTKAQEKKLAAEKDRADAAVRELEELKEAVFALVVSDPPGGGVNG